ncbi:hypothetical protein LTR53_014781 [Teratosphaeriaceae sp. CCFEE 6253]|nr:hypothetical protein LTR53_014781 [Teratosphaeriaceae sp. CCFEE 6253]
MSVRALDTCIARQREYRREQSRLKKETVGRRSPAIDTLANMGAPPRINVLTISLSAHLHRIPASTALDTAWSNPTTAATAATRARFNNVAFDLDPTDLPRTLQELREMLHGTPWDGVLIGWCSRGDPTRTELFEGVVGVCVEEIRDGLEAKLMFCTGLGDLVNATLRNFPESVC